MTLTKNRNKLVTLRNRIILFRLEVFRHQQDSVGIYGLSPVGIPSFEVEDDAGPSMCNLLSYMTESILFGPSLRLSQPYMDCLSDYISGCVT
jgi:hypothetical protein